MRRPDTTVSITVGIRAVVWRVRWVWGKWARGDQKRSGVGRLKRRDKGRPRGRTYDTGPQAYDPRARTFQQTCPNGNLNEIYIICNRRQCDYKIVKIETKINLLHMIDSVAQPIENAIAFARTNKTVIVIFVLRNSLSARPITCFSVAQCMSVVDPGAVQRLRQRKYRSPVAPL